MIYRVALGIMLPFVGTAFGSAAVFFLKKQSRILETVLSSVAAGVMTAASVWSLIIPSVELCESFGRLAFFPALTGLAAGLAFLTALDRFVLKIRESKRGNESEKKGSFLMSFLAVTIHNFPEGMAVGMLYASCLAGTKGVTAAMAFTFAMAITLQNIPEGAIISMPLHSIGESRGRAFLTGVLSGVVEPLGAVLTLVATGVAGRALPYLFGFAAGAMLFVVADELICKREDESAMPVSALSFGGGFALMMVMDVALG